MPIHGSSTTAETSTNSPSSTTSKDSSPTNCKTQLPTPYSTFNSKELNFPRRLKKKEVILDQEDKQFLKNLTMKPGKSQKKLKKSKKKKSKDKKGSKKKDNNLMEINFNEINEMMGQEKKKKAVFKPIKDVKK